MTAPPICFLRGTRVLTSQGEICVENLKIGDLIELSAAMHFRSDGLGVSCLGSQPNAGILAFCRFEYRHGH